LGLLFLHRLRLRLPRELPEISLWRRYGGSLRFCLFLFLFLFHLQVEVEAVEVAVQALLPRLLKKKEKEKSQR
jgi:hypothetical protein